MGFSQDEGYVPLTVAELMAYVMDNVNTQFSTTYTEETFIGSNHYKFYYALIQRLQESEIKTSEIFLKLQQYFALTNERISRPVVTPPGLIEKFESEGFLCSVKPMIDADAGKVYVCVDKTQDNPGDDWEDSDDYADEKLAACTLIKDSVAAGVVSQGSESETIVLTNGQSFDFKFVLPTRVDILVRLTVTLSENNQVAIDDPETQKQRLLDNINERYSLGKNFEPNRYFNVTDDAPWAESVLLEWSDDAGSNYYDTVYDADYDDFFRVLLENIELVEA
jgi:hypothetical protein